MTTGEKIKELRIKMNMTIAELAKKVAYNSATSISKIENDERDIPKNKIELFARVLNTTPEYLMGWKANEEYSAGEKNLIENYRRLNEHGKIKAYDYISDLIGNPAFLRTEEINRERKFIITRANSNDASALIYKEKEEKLTMTGSVAEPKY